MSPNEFKRHMISVHKYRRALRCHQCATIFDDIESFVAHSEHHLHKPFACEICDLTFANKKEQERDRYQTISSFRIRSVINFSKTAFMFRVFSIGFANYY